MTSCYLTQLCIKKGGFIKVNRFCCFRTQNMLKCWIYLFLSALCVYFLTENVSGYCTQGTYGLNCNYTCHCDINNCDDVTGCNGGPNSCKSGWSGPKCTVENVAFGKKTTQSSYYPPQYRNSSLAVDGDTTTTDFYCILTDVNKQPSWWQVDLGDFYFIQEVIIYFRTDFTVRRDGVELYSSKEANQINTGHLCGKTDINNSDITHLTCNQNDRYITLYRNKVDFSIDFCEVQSFVCDPGTYGEHCTEFCHCKTHPCNYTTGKCSDGCETNWTESSCNVCDSSHYGELCGEDCSARHCNGSSTCNNVTGKCDNGCTAGFISADCKQQCSRDRYGQNCSNLCTDRKCFENLICDHVNGTCVDGCQRGYESTDCTTSCKGTYGYNCNMSCADRHCKGRQDCDTENGTCIDGCVAGWEQPDCTVAAQEQSNVSGGLVGGVVAAVSVAIIVAVVVTVIFRKRRRSDKDTDNAPMSEVGRTSRDERREKKDENVYENLNPSTTMSSETNDVSQSDIDVSVDVVASSDTEVQETNEEYNGDVLNDGNPYYNDVKEVPTFCLPEDGFDVSELESIIESIRGQRGGFEAEFLKLPSGFKHPYTDSQIPENRKKNRFAGYYPYDNNRVKLTTLKDIPHSDYINASYVDGYKMKNFFIASQAPNKVTLPDFWRMIWEKNCGQIVMLTNLIEEGKHKCEPYWNDQTKLTVELFDVVVTEVNVRANYTTRKIQVTQRKTRKTKTFDHFHFTSWPDHGVPKAVDILDFFWLTKETSPPRPGPVLVHCSAGIGRTGTYIALHILTDEMKTGRINILGVMTRLREQRKNMVQTHSQYEHIFNVMVEIVKYGLTSMSVSDYVEGYSKDKSSLLMGKKTVRQLAQIIATTETSGTGKLLNNRLWVDGREDLFVVGAPSSLLKTGYLLVYTPNRTENLLWKLITENDSLTLIILGHQSNVSFIPPVSQSRIYGSITITTINETNITKEITLRTLKLESKESPNKKEVVSFWVQSWTSARDTPAAMRYLITLTEQLMDRQTKLKFHPITVVFEESEKKQGVSLCILNNIMSSVFTDKRVEIFNNVRRLQTVLPNIHISEDDFIFFCSIPFAHLESSGIYANI